MELRLAGFLDNSLVNGKGLRSVVFVSGCKHNCDGCQNCEMQDFNYGETVSINDIYDRIKDNIPIIKGVTFSGGEPMEHAKELWTLGCMLKELNLNIWCYTGYTFEDIQNQANSNDKPYFRKLLEVVDVLVDGRFEKDKASSDLKFRGSSNQRIIDVPKSLHTNSIVLYNLD